jgi:Xaa-Pro dipeptidase
MIAPGIARTFHTANNQGGARAMKTLSRRALFELAAAGAAVSAAAAGNPAADKTESERRAAATATHRASTLPPISAQEHEARLAKVQGLMQQRKVAALLLEAGSSLEYFTGIHWWRSERTTAAVIPAQGRVVVVTPYFEEPSVRESLKVAAELRTWKEDKSPFELLAGAFREHAALPGPLAVEATTRFFIVEHMVRSVGRRANVVPGDDLVNACRMIKSATELALMQAANDITISALRQLHTAVAPGMSNDEILKLLIATTNRLGGTYEFGLVLLNEASAYPHGSDKPQKVRQGSVILIDTGCSVHGYQSDISRSWIHGEPSPRQRELWATVKHGQELALETAKRGAAVGAIDRAVRGFYEQKGWSRDYALPGLSHRTGHGIGMDVHEAPYLVRNDETPLQPGMCFSDEPGLYIPGEFGIRLEDCWYMTEAGPKTFTPLARSIDQPI